MSVAVSTTVAIGGIDVVGSRLEPVAVRDEAVFDEAHQRGSGPNNRVRDARPTWQNRRRPPVTVTKLRPVESRASPTAPAGRV